MDRESKKYKEFVSFMARLAHTLENNDFIENDIGLKHFIQEKEEITREEAFFYVHLCNYLCDFSLLLVSNNEKELLKHRFMPVEIEEGSKNFQDDVNAEYQRIYPTDRSGRAEKYKKIQREAWLRKLRGIIPEEE